MIEKYSIRTDLALEQKERFEADNVEIPGVVLEENYDEEREIRVTTVRITTEKRGPHHGKARRELYYTGGAKTGCAG